MGVLKLGSVERLADKRAIKDRFIRFGEIRNESDGHASTITSVAMYKAQGARATDPGKDQGEANAPFVDNKLALFFSAVNGANPLIRMWWKFLDGVNMWLGRSKRGR